MNSGILEIKDLKPISFSWDALAKAVYITFSTKPAAKTVQTNQHTCIDYDASGKIVGVELFRLTKFKATFKRVIKDTEKSLPSACKQILENCLHAV